MEIREGKGHQVYIVFPSGAIKPLPFFYHASRKNLHVSVSCGYFVFYRLTREKPYYKITRTVSCDFNPSLIKKMILKKYLYVLYDKYIIVVDSYPFVKMTLKHVPDTISVEEKEQYRRLVVRIYLHYGDTKVGYELPDYFWIYSFPIVGLTGKRVTLYPI